MSGFFERMAQRATGAETRWEARPRTRYEPAAPRVGDELEVVDAMAERPGTADDRVPADHTPADRALADRAPVDRGPSVPTGAPAAVPTPVPTPVPGDPGRVRSAASASQPTRPGPPAPPLRDPRPKDGTPARPPVRLPAPAPPPVATVAAVPPVPTAAAPTVERAGPRAAPTPAPDVLDHQLDDELDDPVPSRRSRTVDPVAAPGRAVPAGDTGAASPVQARPTAPEIPDTETLLRVHVVHALESRGLLAPGEHVELVDRSADPPTSRPRAPRPGRVGVAHAEVRTGDPTSSDAHTTEVHVHIDRVEVVHAAPPVPPPLVPPPGPAGPSRLDEYLDQRQANRR